MNATKFNKSCWFALEKVFESAFRRHEKDSYDKESSPLGKAFQPDTLLLSKEPDDSLTGDVFGRPVILMDGLKGILKATTEDGKDLIEFDYTKIRSFEVKEVSDVLFLTVKIYSNKGDYKKVVFCTK